MFIILYSELVPFSNPKLQILCSYSTSSQITLFIFLAVLELIALKTRLTRMVSSTNTYIFSSCLSIFSNQFPWYVYIA